MTTQIQFNTVKLSSTAQNMWQGLKEDAYSVWSFLSSGYNAAKGLLKTTKAILLTGETIVNAIATVPPMVTSKAEFSQATNEMFTSAGKAITEFSQAGSAFYTAGTQIGESVTHLYNACCHGYQAAQDACGIIEEVEVLSEVNKHSYSARLVAPMANALAI